MSRYRSLAAVLALLAFSASTCGTPTVRATCAAKNVFAEEPFYASRAEPEQIVAGTLEWRNTPATPNGRDHRYFIDNVPVYSGGATTEPLFKEAAGATVEIRGKVVDAGFGPDIWVATLTACR